MLVSLYCHYLESLATCLLVAGTRFSLLSVAPCVGGRAQGHWVIKSLQILLSSRRAAWDPGETALFSFATQRDPEKGLI